jgi:hypothetical protein
MRSCSSDKIQTCLFFIDADAGTCVDCQRAPRMLGRTSILRSAAPRLKPVNPRTPVALEQSTMITGRNIQCRRAHVFCLLSP